MSRNRRHKQQEEACMQARSHPETDLLCSNPQKSNGTGRPMKRRISLGDFGSLPVTELHGILPTQANLQVISSAFVMEESPPDSQLTVLVMQISLWPYLSKGIISLSDMIASDTSQRNNQHRGQCQARCERALWKQDRVCFVQHEGIQHVHAI